MIQSRLLNLKAQIYFFINLKKTRLKKKKNNNKTKFIIKIFDFLTKQI
jgi:hypothetical protein